MYDCVNFWKKPNVNKLICYLINLLSLVTSLHIYQNNGSIWQVYSQLGANIACKLFNLPKNNSAKIPIQHYCRKDVSTDWRHSWFLNGNAQRLFHDILECQGYFEGGSEKHDQGDHPYNRRMGVSW